MKILLIIGIWIVVSFLFGLGLGRVIKNGERREKKIMEELEREEKIRTMFR